MDRAKLKQLRAALETAHEQVCREVGVAISVGTITCRAGRATARLVVLDAGPSVVTSVGGPVKSADEVAYEKYAKAAGLDVPLGTPFKSQGVTFKIAGWLPTKYKYPVLALNPNGKRYKFPLAQVKAALGTKRPESVILEELRRVECDLSPENVSGDGEYPRSYVQQRVSELNRKKAALVAELGREPTDQELYPELFRRKAAV
jgi:hypothetical protein